MRHQSSAFGSEALSVQGLLTKNPRSRLGWPALLEHPFVRETQEEREHRAAAQEKASQVADGSRAWRGEELDTAGMARRINPGHQSSVHLKPSHTAWHCSCFALGGEGTVSGMMPMWVVCCSFGVRFAWRFKASTKTATNHSSGSALLRTAPTGCSQEGWDPPKQQGSAKGHTRLRYAYSFYSYLDWPFKAACSGGKTFLV